MLRFGTISSFTLLVAVTSLPRCAAYRRLPLPDQPDVAGAVPHVRVSNAAFQRPGVPSTYTIEPANGLSADGAAILAVLQNPGAACL